jgi:hypothetical protein
MYYYLVKPCVRRTRENLTPNPLSVATERGLGVR